MYITPSAGNGAAPKEDQVMSGWFWIQVLCKVRLFSVGRLVFLALESYQRWRLYLAYVYPGKLVNSFFQFKSELDYFHFILLDIFIYKVICVFNL